VVAEDLAQRSGDLAHGRVRANRREYARHRVLAGAGCHGHLLERGSDGLGVPPSLHFLEPGKLALPDRLRDGQHLDVLLLGADCVFRDGAFANRVGTRELAATATERGVPVLVACETFKLAPFDAPGPGADDWEDEDPFDLTPAEYVDRYVTDEGDFDPADIAALVDQTPFLKEGWELLSGSRR